MILRLFKRGTCRENICFCSSFPSPSSTVKQVVPIRRCVRILCFVVHSYPRHILLACRISDFPIKVFLNFFFLRFLYRCERTRRALV